MLFGRQLKIDVSTFDVSSPILLGHHSFKKPVSSRDFSSLNHFCFFDPVAKEASSIPNECSNIGSNAIFNSDGSENNGVTVKQVSKPAPATSIAKKSPSTNWLSNHADQAKQKNSVSTAKKLKPSVPNTKPLNNPSTGLKSSSL